MVLLGCIGQSDGCWALKRISSRSWGMSPVHVYFSLTSTSSVVWEPLPQDCTHQPRLLPLVTPSSSPLACPVWPHPRRGDHGESCAGLRGRAEELLHHYHPRPIGQTQDLTPNKRQGRLRNTVFSMANRREMEQALPSSVHVLPGQLDSTCLSIS